MNMNINNSDSTINQMVKTSNHEDKDAYTISDFAVGEYFDDVDRLIRAMEDSHYESLYGEQVFA